MTGTIRFARALTGVSAAVSHIAVDLGNTSGRVSVVSLHGDHLDIAEILRFPNRSLRTDGRLEWDIAHLIANVKEGIRLASVHDPEIQSIGIDTWGVDFALIDGSGTLLANPVHHRDAGNRAIQPTVWKAITPEALFARTGIQDFPINSLYQLAAIHADRPELLKNATALLMIGDYVRFALTGQIACERTGASTTQLIDIRTGEWNRELAELLEIPPAILPPLVAPGTMAGTVLPAVAGELGISELPVIAVAQHDTASAVYAVPGDAECAWLSLGTWGLLGTGVDDPLLTDAVRLANLTNEAGANGNIRLLKILAGLWLYERCRASWTAGGEDLTHDEITAAIASAEECKWLFDPDHADLLDPPDMPAAISALLTDGELSRGEILRAITDSLALKVRTVLDTVESASSRNFPGLHVVGGGSRNGPLCQAIANAIERPVWAGPVEATTIGNALLQMRTLGVIESDEEARQCVAASFPIQSFLPQSADKWRTALRRFSQLGSVPTGHIAPTA
jgi:rhamnulokinase